MPKLEYVSPQDIDAMHQSAVEVLEKTGIRTLSQRFMDACSEVGLKVVKNEGDKFATIYFTEAQINQAIASAPSSFTTYGLDDSNQIKWGEKRAYTHTCVGVPFIQCLDSRLSRTTTIEDLEGYVRIADALPQTDIISSLTVQGIPDHAANAIQVGAMCRNSIKPLRICIESAHESEDVINVLTAAVGGFERLQEKPIAYLEISPISPLDYSLNPAEALLDIVEAGLPLGIIPCPMIGATGPMTLVGTVVMHHAEMLAGVVVAQLIKPGHPTVMSPRVTFMNLSTMLGLWAAPEMGIAAAVSTQLINKYNIPNTIAGYSCAAKTSDAQAGFEVMFNSILASMVGVDVIGASGSLDNCLIASYEKLVVDNEVSSLVQRAVEGCVVNENTMAVDVIHDVVNGERNFLAHEHTFEHMYTELWKPNISDRQSYDAWKKEHKSLAEVSNEKVRDILANHEVNSLDDEKLKAVNDAVQAAIDAK